MPALFCPPSPGSSREGGTPWSLANLGLNVCLELNPDVVKSREDQDMGAVPLPDSHPLPPIEVGRECGGGVSSLATSGKEEVRLH